MDYPETSQKSFSSTIRTFGKVSEVLHYFEQINVPYIQTFFLEETPLKHK